MPQAISSLSGRVGAKHSPLSLRMCIHFPQRMLRPYALPGIMMASRGLCRRHTRWDTPRDVGVHPMVRRNRVFISPQASVGFRQWEDSSAMNGRRRA